MKKKLFILFFLLVHIAFSQTKIDSLRKVVSKEKDNTVKTKIYLLLGDEYKQIKPDSTEYFYQEVLRISRDKGDEESRVEGLDRLAEFNKRKDYNKTLAYYNEIITIHRKNKSPNKEADVLRKMGVLCKAYSHRELALDYLNQSIIICKNNEYWDGLTKSYTTSGVMYYNMGKYDEAIDFFMNSLKLDDKLKNTKYKYSSYVNIANVYAEQFNSEKAIEYYKKAEVIAVSNKDSARIANVYKNLATVFLDISNPDEAIRYSLKALSLSNGKGYISTIYLNIAIAYEDKGDYNNALVYNLKAFKAAQKSKRRISLARTTGNLASNYYYLKQYEKGIPFAKQSLAISSDIQATREKMLAYQYLSDLYKGTHNYKKAFEYQDLKTTLKDSIFNIRKTEKINEISTKYETEKKDLEIANKALEVASLEKAARRNKIYLITTALLLFLLVLVVVLVYRQRLMKSKYEAEKFNQKLLRLQMNPHFIFNALTSIQSYMFEGDTKKAAFYLSSFAKLTRSILNSSRKDFVSIQEDADNNDDYLKIQQMRFEGVFDYKISIDENIDPDQLQIAPMLIQPFIENAIVHGFKDLDYKGELQIDYKKEGEKIVITIQDNGKGVLSTSENKIHQSHALSITKERLNILNKKANNTIEFEVFESKKGYKVMFTIPLKVA